MFSTLFTTTTLSFVSNPNPNHVHVVRLQVNVLLAHGARPDREVDGVDAFKVAELHEQPAQLQQLTHPLAAPING